MAERKYVLRKGIEGIIPSVFGESFRFFDDFSKRIKELPKEAQNYIQFIEKETGIPASLIGTGQGREEMIVQ